MPAMRWTKSPLRKATPPPEDAIQIGLYLVIIHKGEAITVTPNLSFTDGIALIEDEFEKEQAFHGSIERQV